MYLLIWGCVAILLFAFCSYSIGRDPNIDERDIIAIFFAAFGVSLFWPLILAFLCVVGPFFLLYELGVKHAAVQAEKEKMWNTLKQ